MALDIDHARSRSTTPLPMTGARVNAISKTINRLDPATTASEAAGGAPAGECRKMRLGRAIVVMSVAIVALIFISLFVLSDVPSDTEDSTEQLMTYLSLLLFVMALVLISALAFVVSRGQSEPRSEGSTSEEVEEEGGDSSESYGGASDIELEFEALEKEIAKEENG